MLSFSELLYVAQSLDRLFFDLNLLKNRSYYTCYACAREYMSSVNIKVGRPANFAPVWEMLECSST
jgi:hypothetical protein